jgi:hypothetical protein
LKDNKISISLIIVTILLFIFRGSIPFFKYPFLVLYLGITAFSIKQLRTLSKTIFSFHFFYQYAVILVSFLLFVFSFFITKKIYLETVKDLMNILILFSFYLLMSIYIKKQEDFDYFKKNLIKLIIIFAIVISIYELGNILFLFSYKNLSIDLDYNFAIIPIIFGMIGLLYYVIHAKSIIRKFLYALLLSLFTISILLSGSRRGLLVLAIILGGLVLFQIISIRKTNIEIKRLRTTFLFFTLTMLFLSFVSYLFVFHTSSSFKNKTLMTLGSKNLSPTRDRITKSVTRYVKVFNRNYTFDDVNKLLWTPGFDPKDPDSGWGYRIHTTTYPLSGDKVEIVPEGAKGYLLDKTSGGIEWGGNSYMYTKLYTTKIHDSAIVEASVFCYVSRNFNGNWTRLILSPDNLTWIGSASYDTLKNGTWQKLSLTTTCKEKEVSMFLYFCKNGTLSFKNLTGYVIFAYPQLNIISEKDSILANSNPTKKTKNVRVDFKINRKSIIGPQNNKIITASASFDFLHFFFTNNLSTLKETDPLRAWISKLISEDTTYYKFNSIIDVDTASNPFIESRSRRWQFAKQIFTKEYTWPQRIIGGGFNFLNWFGYYFDNDKTRSDYPHNPFLSVLLYSGILGLIVYVMFIFKVFYYYIKYFKEYQILPIFFIITFFFSFFSAGNPFDPPIMGFFIILPFFIHSVHIKSMSENGNIKLEVEIDERIEKM